MFDPSSNCLDPFYDDHQSNWFALPLFTKGFEMKHLVGSLPTFDRFCHGRDNNFNLLRLIAAFAVAVSHSSLLTYGTGVPQPLLELTGYTLGHHAVNIFFMISGFLIYQSYLSSEHLRSFVMARLLRIFPALIVAGLLVVIIGGLLFSSASPSDYWTYSDTWIYLVGTSSAFFSSLRLPGLFEQLIVSGEVNGSLWTLKWELMAYMAVPILGLIGGYKIQGRFALVLVGFVIVNLAISLQTDWRKDLMMLDDALRLGLCFLLGMGVYHYRQKIAVSLGNAFLLWVLVWLVRESGFYEISLMVAMAYTVFWFAFIPAGWLRCYNRLGDYSYGIYIFHFPVMQMVMQIYAPSSANETLMLAFLVFLPLSILSFHLIEKPALRLRRRWSRIPLKPLEAGT